MAGQDANNTNNTAATGAGSNQGSATQAAPSGSNYAPPSYGAAPSAYGSAPAQAGPYASYSSPLRPAGPQYSSYSGSGYNGSGYNGSPRNIIREVIPVTDIEVHEYDEVVPEYHVVNEPVTTMVPQVQVHPVESVRYETVEEVHQVPVVNMVPRTFEREEEYVVDEVVYHTQMVEEPVTTYRDEVVQREVLQEVQREVMEPVQVPYTVPVERTQMRLQQQSRIVTDTVVRHEIENVPVTHYQERIVEEPVTEMHRQIVAEPVTRTRTEYVDEPVVTMQRRSIEVPETTYVTREASYPVEEMVPQTRYVQQEVVEQVPTTRTETVYEEHESWVERPIQVPHTEYVPQQRPVQGFEMVPVQREYPTMHWEQRVVDVPQTVMRPHVHQIQEAVPITEYVTEFRVHQQPRIIEEPYIDYGTSAAPPARTRFASRSMMIHCDSDSYTASAVVKITHFSRIKETLPFAPRAPASRPSPTLTSPPTTRYDPPAHRPRPPPPVNDDTL